MLATILTSSKSDSKSIFPKAVDAETSEPPKERAIRKSFEKIFEIQLNLSFKFKVQYVLHRDQNCYIIKKIIKCRSTIWEIQNC
jgi:hypothetical protein